MGLGGGVGGGGHMGTHCILFCSCCHCSYGIADRFPRNPVSCCAGGGTWLHTVFCFEAVVAFHMV